MKLMLFSQQKTTEYFLPNQVSGSYNFGEDPATEIKLFKVDAVNERWIIKPLDNSLLMHNNEMKDELELVENEFYVIKKEEDSFLVLTGPTFEPGYKIYEYNNEVDVLVGNSDECNLRYNCPYLSGIAIEIIKTSEGLKLANSMETLVYINNEVLTVRECELRTGDVINIFGLKIIVLEQTLMINSPFGGTVLNTMSSGLVELGVTTEKYKNTEVKDIDLYDKNDYFSKSPRIRRIIETKNLKIDAPPNKEQNETMPVILTAGPMITMALTSSMTLVNTITQLNSGQIQMAQAWPGLASGILMLVSSLLWPVITKAYNKHSEREERKKTIRLYTEYLEKKKAILQKEIINQKNIWEENLLPLNECLKIINSKKNNFWCKRSEQSDFLSVRAGIGRVPLKVEVEWPEEGFSIEQDELKEMAEALIEEYKYIDECPLEYSFSNNFLTAIMGVEKKCYGFVNNILVQLMTFYCYDELKVVVFTDEEKEPRWDYLKYSNFCFTNDKSVRFFATNIDEAKELGSFLMQDLVVKKEIFEESQKAKKDANNGEEEDNKKDGSLSFSKPHYLIICDSYNSYKKIEFFKTLTELEGNVGYSTIIIEKNLDKLPSKCINFINLNEGSSGILKNSYEKAEIVDFHDEITYSINMMELTKSLSNIPVEIEGEGANLPNAIDFLEMEKVGKVEQLNILNRWNTNDSTKSLKAEVGVDEELNLMYLDLHEKFHGPHGLIAGTTGSGKSEFIITYILSMAMNYSPDDVAFILIDYKGGGLAYAFENKTTGVKLPHLAGTITNLDKAEMNRTLVSIDSEVKRRQAEFNKARDMLGESTIDIYKYQGFYHEGKLQEPIPHLFLIADEFAELKAQQPDFMDNLISVARIGRSLGVHLILATQKPSGVVNDQIWSNTKFRVCLKVADAGDSKEMIKKPDAALLKQAGRFYLQVGMDEYFALGQSGWAGAKYYPSDTIQKQVDKSINFINNNGQIIKTIQENNDQQKKEAQGEQIAAVLNEIITVAKQTNKEAKRLWLDNIPNLILVDEIEKRYNILPNKFDVTAIIGEYDAPELQEQGIVSHNYIEKGNTLILGTDGGENERLLMSMIYSTAKNYTNEEIFMYIADYGSEALRIFANLPQLGGMIFNGDRDGLKNLIKLVDNEIKERKKLFVNYGGDYKSYNKSSDNKLPIMVFYINNYDSLVEFDQSFYELATDFFRDTERYGIFFVITGSGTRALGSKAIDNFPARYALRVNDPFDYGDILGGKINRLPADMPGRGFINNGDIHEFQTASIVEDDSKLSEYIMGLTERIKDKNQNHVKKIPTLPEVVKMEDVQESIKDKSCVPVGIYKGDLSVATLNLEQNIGTIITSNKIKNLTNFAKSIVKVLRQVGLGVILVDGTKELDSVKDYTANYFADELSDKFDKINEVIDKNIEENTDLKAAIVIYAVDKVISKIDGDSKLEELTKKLKKYEKVPIIVIEEATKVKNYQFDNWYKSLFENVDGIWIGTNPGDQTVLRVNGYSKEFSGEFPNNIGFYISEGIIKTFKTIELEEGAKEDEQ